MAFIVIDDRIKGRIVMMGLIGQLQEEDMNMKNEFLCMIGWGAECLRMIDWETECLHMKDWGQVLVFCNIMNKIRKRADTTVAFTQEYSRVSYPLGNVSTLPTGSNCPRTHTH